MRKHCVEVLKQQFHSHLIRLRDDMEISQEEMAQRLMMASRSYVDLEHGENCCSALTFALFLIYICPDSIAFLEELQAALEKVLEAA